MNQDIRISVDFWNHPKTGRLIRAVGLKGVRSLQILWMWAARNKPDGKLFGLDAADIEFAADWRGRKGAFFAAILGQWLDETDEGRYEELKPTVLVSNLPVEELPEYLGARLMDRLRENGGVVVPLTWASERGLRVAA